MRVVIRVGGASRRRVQVVPLNFKIPLINVFDLYLWRQIFFHKPDAWSVFDKNKQITKHEKGRYKIP